MEFSMPCNPLRYPKVRSDLSADSDMRERERIRGRMEVGHDGNGTRKWKEGKGSFAVRHQIEKPLPDRNRQSLCSPLPLSLHR